MTTLGVAVLTKATTEPVHEPVLTATALEGLPEVTPGDDLADLIAQALTQHHEAIEPGDVLVIAHKIVSKAEGRIRRLADVEPGDRAAELARELNKDPRHVQIVLDESQAVLRAIRGVLICVTHHGFVISPSDDATIAAVIDQLRELGRVEQTLWLGVAE